MSLDPKSPIIDVLTGDRIEGMGVRVDAVILRLLDRPSTAAWDEDWLGKPKPERAICAEAWSGGVCIVGAAHNTREWALDSLCRELGEMYL